MSWVSLLIYAALGLLAYFYFFRKKPRSKNYPPGPWGLPIIGNMFAMGNAPHVKVTEWAKKYGPIYSMEFGMYPGVVLSDLKLIRQAFNDPDCSGRPDWPLISARSNGVVEGVIQTEGKKWQEQRRFILRTLRDFGFGKRSMEVIVQDEIKELIETMRKSVNTPITMESRFNAAVLNALWTIVAGERFKQDDPELQVAIKHLDANQQEINMRAMLSNFVPFIAKYFPKLSGFEKMIKDIFPVLEFLRKPIQQHKDTIHYGQPRDFIDVFLDEIEKTTDPTSSFYKDQGERSLLFSTFDIFGAGAGTVSTTLMSTFMYLAKWPQIQKKLHTEIDKAVGNSRLPSLSDRPMMPYTDAVIHEVLRFSTLLPISIQNTFKEVELGGFTIPANTMIMANRWATNFDKELWGDPEVFRPERFIGKDGAFVKHEAFMAFSLGKRQCLGEVLARDELFLFLTSLFQAFNVAPTTSPEEMIIEQRFSGVLMPVPLHLIITERN